MVLEYTLWDLTNLLNGHIIGYNEMHGSLVLVGEPLHEVVNPSVYILIQLHTPIINFRNTLS